MNNRLSNYCEECGVKLEEGTIWALQAELHIVRNGTNTSYQQVAHNYCLECCDRRKEAGA